jgi:hypothetical protein
METALRELEKLLPGDNYIVDFQVHRISFDPTWTPRQYIEAAVGAGPPLKEISPVSVPDLLAEVEYCLRYDRGQYRCQQTALHQSQRFLQLAGCVRAYLEQLSATSTAIFRFRRDDPIEWQFSFLFIGPNHAEVFTGWGSD